MSIIHLSIWDLGLCALLVCSLAWINWRQAPDLSSGILIGVARLTIQLSLIGMALKFLFAQTSLPWVLMVCLFMAAMAGREVGARQEHRFTEGWTFRIGLFAMTASSYSMILIVLLALIQPEPWYKPQYAIPLLGMILGNTLNGVSLCLDRLTAGARNQKDLIEGRLMLGEPAEEAIQDQRRQALHAGMTPAINGMATAGVVSLPGMMTGQILAGSPPETAVAYQIMIFLMIVAATGFGTWIANRLAIWRLFDERHRLRLDRLALK
ncbi:MULTISPECIES: ABC transporter permease [unclassified Hahella]|uniref:ABC transporter permease n=1 Tax=unclassified Hahella TaxID=2624107 RepID=UPI001C1F1880|nr:MULTISPECIES: ABC transporter permease [unclassified Hahella]MBU6954879.1 ABC transporter permease [Hahella sp. HN01]MDG9669705.1 ABC transporter permease [Hahella sp. CR1]